MKLIDDSCMKTCCFPLAVSEFINSRDTNIHTPLCITSFNYLRTCSFMTSNLCIKNTMYSVFMILSPSWTYVFRGSILSQFFCHRICNFRCEVFRNVETTESTVDNSSVSYSNFCQLGYIICWQLEEFFFRSYSSSPSVGTSVELHSVMQYRMFTSALVYFFFCAFWPLRSRDSDLPFEAVVVQFFASVYGMCILEGSHFDHVLAKLTAVSAQTHVRQFKCRSKHMKGRSLVYIHIYIKIFK